MNTSAWAMLIIGSLIICGGLAYFISIAVRSNKP
ncbi:MetS family NSS transporter small subunit [Desmospora profundinema]|uniref:MetS family NSS transporter small subunit n=1 Tax=Desmospora profundinema TaxID=1571184 RepID=A0ABU1ILN1_9BACL|nr:MetS family NSS transporter small subunit [Desmospora profundinema]MDR6225691.1 hypothetical protein [Desmospora profundinema]